MLVEYVWFVKAGVVDVLVVLVIVPERSNPASILFVETNPTVSLCSASIYPATCPAVASNDKATCRGLVPDTNANIFVLVVVSVDVPKYLLILPPVVIPPEVIVKVPATGAVGVGAIVLGPAVPNANVPPLVLILPLKVKAPETVPVFAPDNKAFDVKLTPLTFELLMVKLVKLAVGNALVKGNKFLNKPVPAIDLLAVF